MATRSRSRRPAEQPRRRSLRLRKDTFHEHKNVAALDMATPRTVFRKVLQTQPVVPPFVPEKASSPIPVETVSKFPSTNTADSNLEISLTGPIPEETFHPVLLKRGNKKKIRLSEFERAVDKQVPSATAVSLLDNTSLTRSLQVSLGTPVTPPPDGKRGLMRRPKSYKGVNVMTFEGGMGQNVPQMKGSQNHHVDFQISAVSNASAPTELFAQTQLSGQSRAEVPVLPSQPASARKSLSQGAVLPSAADRKTPQQHAESDTNTDMTWHDQKDILSPELDCVDGTQGVPEGKDSSAREEQQEESELAVEGGMIGSNLKPALRPDTEHAAEMDSGPHQRTVSLGRGQQESPHSAPLVGKRESPHSGHLIEQRKSLRSGPFMEQRESEHSGPLMEMLKTPRSGPLVELRKTPRSVPLVEQQETPRSGPLMELRESPRSGPLMELRKTPRSGPLMELQESPCSGPLTKLWKTPRSDPLMELRESPHRGPLMELREEHSSPKEHLLSGENHLQA